MLIYKIARQITYRINKYEYTLRCTFPSGNRHINVKLICRDKPEEAQKFELNPETPIEVPVLLCSRNET